MAFEYLNQQIEHVFQVGGKTFKTYIKGNSLNWLFTCGRIVDFSTRTGTVKEDSWRENNILQISPACA